MFSSQQFQICQSLQKGSNYRTGQSITVLFQICILHLTIDICLIRKLPTYFKPNKIINSLKFFTNYFFVQSPCFLTGFFKKERKEKSLKTNTQKFLFSNRYYLTSSTFQHQSRSLIKNKNKTKIDNLCFNENILLMLNKTRHKNYNVSLHWNFTNFSTLLL